jgi:hypothetical protein
VLAVRRTGLRFVAQELVTDPLTLGGRKLDFRIYILVSSFSPLRFRVYRGGVARLAARHYDSHALVDPLRVLTGASYRKRHHLRIDNATIADVTAGLGNGPEFFWTAINALVANVCGSYASWLQHTGVRRLKRHFYLSGIDVIARGRPDSYQVLFIESNYVPQLNNWGTNVDETMQDVHRAWLRDLHDLACARTVQ